MDHGDDTAALRVALAVDKSWQGRRAAPLPELIQEYEARIAALERLVGKQALELEFLRAFSSLIGVVEVKLFLIGFVVTIVAPVGHSLLFAVGARPPHDGVRRARRLNLFHDLAG